MNQIRTNSDLLGMLFKTGVASIKTDVLPDQARELVEHVKASVAAQGDESAESNVSSEFSGECIEVEGEEIK